ncbi:protein FLOWERING LOCUS D isoform X2 [Andrographis paniculata]|nr:protein FLOWERING LOCUS D isoform X2 [Andrographis paniculata]
MSEEIIVINKEATSEALIALTAGFPADSLTEEEIEYGVVSVVGGIEQVNYILIRNHIIRRWRENVSIYITKEMFIDIVPKHCGKLLDTAYGYLVSHGYINFGVAPAIKERVSPEPRPLNVIVIGAGLAGLGAARQLMAFGFKVTVLEGRKRPGGRVYTKKLEGSNMVAAADLGGSVLTGTLGNPLGILARQLSFTLHKVRDKCPLYRVDGTPVDPDLDRRVENSFNQLLDKLSKLRLSMGEVSQDVSLGAALETFREDFSDEEMAMFSWHLANLEYANAGLISNLSLAFWDQDDPYDMGGDHCFLPGGNGRLVQALAEGVPIHYEKTVQAIRYGSNGVKVAVSGGQIYEADMALCTVPLGVLKNGSIKFIPELPQRKLDAIRRLGFGLLNKVALLFPYPFWGNHLDTFGHLSDHPSRRGEFFLFYSYATVAGGPILIGLVAGEAAYKFEVMEPTDAVERVLRILRDIYEPQGIQVPDPVQTVCTRWGTDPLSCGSYSNVAVGASGDDYDILAENVGDGRLFFAGEATNRRYPATMHGAFLSGFREAANIAHHAKVRSLRLKVEKNPSQNAHTCASILADLFRQPDLEFGGFAVLFGRKNADSMAILRVTFGGHRKKPDQQYTNKLLFEQLQSHFNQQLEFHIYTVLSKQQALDLREVRGGDEGRLNYLEKIGIKLIGRKGLGPYADSVIASIKAERSGHRRTRINKTSSSGLTKLKASSPNQKLIRRAKIVGSSKVSSTLSTVRVSNSGTDVDARVLAASNGLAYPSSNIRVLASSSSRELPPNSGSGADSAADIRRTIPHDSIQTNFSTLPSTESNASNSPALPTSNVGMMLLSDVQGYNPQNNSMRFSNTNGNLSLPLDIQAQNCTSRLEGNSSVSAPSNYVCSNGPASEIETRLVDNCSSPAPSNLIIGGDFNNENFSGDISDGISFISNQDNIFEDIMNDLLPATGSNSGTWHSTGKL